jgi:hypothetical protein
LTIPFLTPVNAGLKFKAELYLSFQEWWESQSCSKYWFGLFFSLPSSRYQFGIWHGYHSNKYRVLTSFYRAAEFRFDQAESAIRDLEAGAVSHWPGWFFQINKQLFPYLTCVSILSTGQLSEDKNESKLYAGMFGTNGCSGQLLL